MLEKSLIEQLKQVFEVLEGHIELVVVPSEHPKQEELLQMLEAVAGTSSSVSLVHDNDAPTSDYPSFRLRKDQLETGVSFVGIPGGHEFSSLVLAILNVDGKGKLPDEGIQSRIRSLKGPVRIRTYISLSCTNCPDVVQALNLMASLHTDFEHQMIDGEYVQDDIERLGIQGVPSVMAGESLVSSGKASLPDLLNRLEKHFGIDDSIDKAPIETRHYDVAIIGAGPAGAATAVYTSRKGLKTAIISDRMGGQLQDTKGIENMISVSYTEGAKLAADLQKHIDVYDIDLLEHRRVQKIEPAIEESDNRFNLSLDSGEPIQARSLVIATGAKWRELGVEGEKEYLGRGVAFCPHCDGPYFKGKDVAVVGGGNSGVEAAIDLAGIVNHVTIIEFMPELKADSVLVDKARATSNIEIVTHAKTQRIIGDGEKVTAIELEDRQSGELTQISLDGVFVQIGLLPNSDFVDGLVERNRFGEIVVDAKCRTNQKGVYAAGDVTTVPYKQIIVAMGEGAKAGLTVFEDLVLAS